MSASVLRLPGDAGIAHVKFTLIEMRIVEFIKEGKTTKEFGQLLTFCLVPSSTYREKIGKSSASRAKMSTCDPTFILFPEVPLRDFSCRNCVFCLYCSCCPRVVG